MNGSQINYFNELIERLKSFSKREKLSVAAIGVQQLFVSIVALFLFIVLLEHIFHFSSTVRTVLILLIGMLFLALLYFTLLKPLKKITRVDEKNFTTTASKIGNLFPALKDEFTNSLQLVSYSISSLYSSALVNAAFERIYFKVKEINFGEAVNFEKAKTFLKFSLPAIFVVLIMILLIPGLNHAAFRLTHFNEEFIPPAKFSFRIIPGNYELTKGESVEVSILTDGEFYGNEITLFKKNEAETDYTKIKLLRDTTSSFVYLFQTMQNSTEYFLSAEDIESEKYKITVIDRPIIRNLTLNISPPNYSNLPQTVQKDNGNITALVGTRVKFSLLASKNISSAKIFFDDTIAIPLSANNNAAEGIFTIKKDVKYFISIKDEKGNENLSPVTYSITSLYDEYPAIDILQPNKDVILSSDQRLAFLLRLKDDYGFDKLLLHYRLAESRYEMPQEKFSSLKIEMNNSMKEQELSHIWNLSSLNLATEDVVQYYFEIFDNDNVSGPKSSRSQMFFIRIPSIDELFTQVDEEQESITQELLKTVKEAEQLKKEIEKIENELKQDKKEITWEEKEKIEKTIEKFDQLQQKVEEMSEQLSSTKDELQKNNMLSEETMQKYMEMQKLMNELSSDEMKRAMEKLQQTLQNLDRKQVQQALENMKFDEEAFKKSLERTINLFKRIQVEQKMDETLKRIEEIQKEQKENEEKTRNSNLNNENEKKSVEKKQEEITNKLEQLEDEMKELQEKMNSMNDMPNEEMKKMMEEMQKQKNESLSEDAQKNLQQEMKQQSLQKQNQVSKNMQKMSDMMKQMQNSMMQANQMKTFTDLMKLLDNILTLSKKEEALKEKSRSQDVNEFNEALREQESLKRNLENLMNQLSELSQKTFAVTPEMGKALGDAKRSMQNGMEGLQNRNGTQALNAQGEAMKSLNQAAMMMKNSLDQMMQGGGQGGMMSLMQQLGQLSGQQMSLNNLTQQLEQLSQGNLSGEQQMQLQRLAQQQQLIQKSLDQLNKEAKQSGKSKALPENLDKILKQMQEVITDMRTEKLDDELVQKQERILSKLLDAQRSINERDFEKERESNTGTNVTRQSPSELYLKKKSDLLRDALLKSIQEGYLKDYEDLIRKYYEELQKEGIKN